MMSCVLFIVGLFVSNSYSYLPAQVAPHAFGAGLLHSRVRIFVPTPHVTEHAQNAVQAPQLPLTEGRRIKYMKKENFSNPSKYLSFQ